MHTGQKHCHTGAGEQFPLVQWNISQMLYAVKPSSYMGWPQGLRLNDIAGVSYC